MNSWQCAKNAVGHFVFFRSLDIEVAMVMEIIKMLQNHMDPKIAKKNYSG